MGPCSHRVSTAAPDRLVLGKYSTSHWPGAQSSASAWVLARSRPAAMARARGAKSVLIEASFDMVVLLSGSVKQGETLP
ncbi:hypothetical protein D3C71_718470 [compost metagenome]